ncbi:MAG: hypothetical protein HQ518_11260 [Rhodopirellula sp.]|nr:hypothetical protein [Rhodopirellula sp.]
MRLLSLDIPDNHAELARWLECHLVGLELRDFIVELEAISETQKVHSNLTELLGKELPSVLESGLVVLSPIHLRALLANPKVLFELQERVLIDGGGHWESLPISDVHQQAVNRGWERLQTTEPSAPTKPAWQQRSLQSAAAIAAMVIFGGGIVWLNQPPAGPSWGWDRPGALTVELSGQEYLNHLADSADEWFKKPRDTKVALAKRLSDFRHGCDTLIEAPHRQLSDENRQWLVEKCKAWSGKLDDHLTALSAGDSVAKVSQAADETINKLILAMRTRATQV